jgi:hypothetical protein
MHEEIPMADKTEQSTIQGEGDYKAARRYIETTDKFAHSGKVESAAAKAKPVTATEQLELETAEKEGLEHSKAPGK